MNLLAKKSWISLGSGVLCAIALTACGTAPTPSVERKNDPAADESGMVQSLRKQIRERDKRIEELQSQLDALKVIDQDFEIRKKPNRLPATLTPLE
jgi:hypothetical protein